jgi:hypothetical protein
LNFLPLPHGHGAFREILKVFMTGFVVLVAPEQEMQQAASYPLSPRGQYADGIALTCGGRLLPSTCCSSTTTCALELRGMGQKLSFFL